MGVAVRRPLASLNRNLSAEIFAHEQSKCSFAVCFRARLIIFTIRDVYFRLRAMRRTTSSRWTDTSPEQGILRTRAAQRSGKRAGQRGAGRYYTMTLAESPE